MWYLKEETIHDWAWADVFGDFDAATIIELGKDKFKTGTVGNTGETDESIRVSDVFFLKDVEEYKWVYETCAFAVNNVNRDFFKYDLIAIETLQLTKYDSTKTSSFYGKHIDVRGNWFEGAHRKLSFSIPLNTDYEGGEFKLYNAKEPSTPDPIVGRGIFFPSNMLHEVTPVTKGCRYSLVGWCTGPRFR
jgi:predicted 2-oxoglutarate/Fe(II)-dependent dioxygenase YbiX